MSIILDALRRGRGRPTPGGKQPPAQADAVLQTLGYTRFKSASPVSRFKRFAGLVIGALLLVLALWGSAISVRHRYFVPASAAKNTATVDKPNVPGSVAPIAPNALVANERNAPVPRSAPGQLVQNSRRPAIPQSVPTAPGSAPSRTALSTLAGAAKQSDDR